MHRVFRPCALVAIMVLSFGLVLPVGAQDATPAAGPGSTSPETETLVDASLDALPTGHAIIELDRVRMRPSPAPLTTAILGGPVIVRVESGEITTTDGDTERRLGPGEQHRFSGNAAISLQPVGSEEAVVFVVYLIPGFEDAGGHGEWEYDPEIYTADWLISTSADALPGGAGRITLERLTIPVGGALPAEEAQPFVWTDVGAGVLGLTLAGEHLPLRWKSGAERTFRPGQYLPALQDGTRMTFRNAGDEDLVLYRLMIVPEMTPGAAGTAKAGTPVS
jgi:hypothetical protein